MLNINIQVDGDLTGKEFLPAWAQPGCVLVRINGVARIERLDRVQDVLTLANVEFDTLAAEEEEYPEGVGVVRIVRMDE